LDNWLLETLPIAEAISSETLYLGDNGELVIKGNQVGMGYLGQQIQSGFEGENSFFTGDLANIHNGYFVVNGRNDRQIKLNAHRIDLSEIENLIAKFSDCMDCLVSLVEPQSDRPELVAFVCTQQVISEMDLRTKLNNHLPLAHIPKRFVFLKQFPLNINGKVDHLALINQSKFDQIDGFNSKGI
jgi:D-alanine--poly(phosphoribitol) ligase subunit 1